MVSKTRILLDLDGVSANFVKAVLDLYNKDYTTSIKTWQPNLYHVHTVLGVEAHEMWDRIDSLGAKFWYEIPEYEWFKELYDALCEIGDVYFCTSPSHNPFCAAGKVKWLQDRFGTKFRKYVLTNQKHLLANSDTILIDDSDRVVNKFYQHQGRVVLFPQPWNRNWSFANSRAASVVLDSVKEHAKLINRG